MTDCGANIFLAAMLLGLGGFLWWAYTVDQRTNDQIAGCHHIGSIAIKSSDGYVCLNPSALSLPGAR